ncbi:hypothetical protein JG688_00010943 [Phytophthora aleatoria]|uniref:Uncharacterized protein n=1 Tax=Phytophthora aleatoria TaxID=2496075 RepID=A0A8J5MEX2_9STRA|nr:hypothetical protein JG688_00010943 [Phytophthora aleatoria]
MFIRARRGMMPWLIIMQYQMAHSNLYNPIGSFKCQRGIAFQVGRQGSYSVERLESFDVMYASSPRSLCNGRERQSHGLQS